MNFIIGPDVSIHKNDASTTQGIDFGKMRDKAKFVMIRAGQNVWPDPDFQTNWQSAKEAGLPRGSYWFYDSRATPQAQADLWAELLQDDPGELPLFGDFEEAYGGPYGGWQNFLTFLEQMEQKYPNREVGIYTSYYYWKDNVPSADRGKFTKYPLWVANYDANQPNIPSDWDNWLFWQFTENGDGKAFGVESSTIDLNYFNGDAASFYLRFGLDPQMPIPPDKNTDVHLTPYIGVKYYKLRRFGADCHVRLIDLSKVRVHVWGGSFVPVEYAARKNGAQIATNGGTWNDRTSKANEIWISDGRILNAKPLDNNPAIGITKDNQVVLIDGYHPVFTDIQQAWGYQRIICRNGEWNSAIQNYDKDPRTCYGRTKDGRLFQLTADGRSPTSAGLTFEECFKLAQEFDIDFMGDCDGGSSTVNYDQVLGNDDIINIPSAGYTAVINPVLFFAEAIAGEQVTTYNYKYINANSMSLRAGPTTLADKLATLSGSTPAYGNELKTYDSAQGVSFAGDKWLHVIEIKGIGTVDYWIAFIHQGRTYGTLTTLQTPELVIDPPVTPDGHTVVLKSVQGIVTIDGIDYPFSM